MKSIQQDTLGFTVTVAGVPATATEYDEMAKETGACVADAVDNVIYRGWLPKFRPAFATALNAALAALGTAFAWSYEEVGAEGKKKKVYEKETKYIERLKAELPKAANPETGEAFGENGANDLMSSIANTVAASIAFSLDAVRTGGKIAKALLEQAETIINNTVETAKANGEEPDFTKIINNVKAKVPSFEFVLDDTTGYPTVESLAFALKAYQAAVLKEASGNLLG